MNATADISTKIVITKVSIQHVTLRIMFSDFLATYDPNRCERGNYCAPTRSVQCTEDEHPRISHHS